MHTQSSLPLPAVPPSQRMTSPPSQWLRPSLRESLLPPPLSRVSCVDKSYHSALEIRPKSNTSPTSPAVPWFKPPAPPSLRGRHGFPCGLCTLAPSTPAGGALSEGPHLTWSRSPGLRPCLAGSSLSLPCSLPPRSSHRAPGLLPRGTGSRPGSLGLERALLPEFHWAHLLTSFGSQPKYPLIRKASRSHCVARQRPLHTPLHRVIFPRHRFPPDIWLQTRHGAIAFPIVPLCSLPTTPTGICDFLHFDHCYIPSP